MSPTSPRLSGALLAFLGCLAAACTAKDESNTSVIPNGPPATSANVIRGTLIGRHGPPPKVQIKVFRGGVTLLTAFGTSSQASGRWSVSGLSAGTYRFEFLPPAAVSNDPSTELRTYQIGSVVYTGGVLTMPPVFYEPVVDGGMLVTENSTAVQTLQFREDPFDLGSAVVPGLDDLTLLIRNNSQFRFFGFTLTALGIDDNTGTSARDLLVEVAILRPDQLPAPHVDADGHSRTSQVYYAFYPSGFDVLQPREIEVDFPNANGLSGVYETPQLAYSHLSGEWVAAGVGDVSSDGVLVEQDNFDGMKQFGTIGSPGPPPPTTVLVGTIMSGGNPLARAGITVITNSGFRGMTDATGAYRIEDVPIPLNRADLVATAYADEGLAFASASASARPIYPETTIDIPLVAVPLAAPTCDLAGSEPTAGAVSVETNARIRLRFDAKMDRETLQAATTVTATPDGMATTTIPGTVVTQDVPMMSGAIHTDAYFLPADPLPTTATVSIFVSSAAKTVDGLALAGGCSLSFRTGTSTLFLPRIDVIEPTSGPVGTSVSIYGANMDIATLSFDGSTLTASSKTKTRLTFTVPTSKGTGPPGPRTVQLDPGAVLSGFDILPRIDAVQIDTDPDPMVEVLAANGFGTPGTSIAGVDQNDGTLVVLTGQNLFDAGSGLMPVVTFGRGDGDPTGATDGDAAIDGPDEAAAEQRIDVNVPPRATTGDLFVTVDDGTGATFSSKPVTYVISLPFDTTAPSIDMPALDPQPAAVGVLTSQIIHVELDEAVAGTSEILVGSGAPLRKVPGTTRVTTSLDGSVGILEFLPESGALPASSTIQVQLTGAAIVDLAGNPAADLAYTFDTGATKPGGGSPPGRGPAVGPIAKAPLDPDGSDPGVEVPGVGAASRELELLRDLSLAGSATADPERSDLGSGVEPLRGPVNRVPDSRLADDGRLEWTGLPPVARWSPESLAPWPRATGLTVAERVESTEDETRVETFLLLELDGQPIPGQHVYRLRVADRSGAALFSGVVNDRDGDGRFELSLVSRPGLDLAALARTDLVRVVRGTLELRLPPHRPLLGEHGPVRVRLESFDLLSASASSSPLLELELH